MSKDYFIVGINSRSERANCICRARGNGKWNGNSGGSFFTFLAPTARLKLSVRMAFLLSFKLKSWQWNSQNYMAYCFDVIYAGYIDSTRYASFLTDLLFFNFRSLMEIRVFISTYLFPRCFLDVFSIDLLNFLDWKYSFLYYTQGY